MEEGHYWKSIIEIPSDANTIARIEKNLSDELKNEFQIWRLVFENVATLQELETIWSLDDVYRALAFHQMQSEIQYSEMKKNDRKRANN